MAEPNQQLQELATLHGVHLNYWDVTGKQVWANDDSLIRTLQALGAPLGGLDDVEAALEQRRRDLWGRRLEPVAVCWDGYPPELLFRCSEADLDTPHQCRLVLESGQTYTWTMTPGELPDAGGIDLDGTVYAARRLRLIGPYALGYHQLTIEGGGHTAECTLIAAPERPAEAQASRTAKNWGLFVPLYALHSARSWGAGDYADLEELVSWVQRQGGGMVATLPLLAAFLDEPFEPSPYSPASRLFWNEFYLNVERIPEVQKSPKAQALLGSRQFKDDVAALRKAPLVNYRDQMALKRRVLEECARTLTADSSGRRAALEEYVQGDPAVRDYAVFRAIGEQRRAAWQTWPAALRDGAVTAGDFDPALADYHCYVQWLAREQLQGLATKARANGPGLYLDLPLGVNSSGYDTWRHREGFALDTAAGAPPDPFFAKGQNWGFPPLHPERIREGGYQYLRAYLRHHMRLAGVLRIDHMMGLHRLYWIPHGMEAKDGVYVGYRAEEQYAVFSLEAHRHGTVIVGEDLGTVPEELPGMMARHNMHRMYVLQYQAQPRDEALSPIFPGAVASINTHDMPTFAAFWQGLDIDDRLDLGLFDAESADEERERRRELIRSVETFLQQRGFLKESKERAAPLAVLRACLNFLATGPGRVALANVEDFWLEAHPQNVPGTWRERPNWMRRARRSLEEFTRMPTVLQALREMDRIVKQGR
ncbi:MAG TPA: 4-alpha-glucanotransferase [Gemmataceae bacterium]|nr:4-alpha-glucanotransferase [Gemmataceae bacterium]